MIAWPPGLSHLALAASALLCDRIVGDPARIPHPVVLMGWWVRRVEGVLYRPQASPRTQRWAGVALWLLVCAPVVVLSEMFLVLLYHLAPWLGWMGGLVLTSTTIAWKGLRAAVASVYQALQCEGLPAARLAVGQIVGRDTAHLSEPEVVRAALETVAENLVDAVVSPVLFGLLGGPSLAMLYRAVNTLDSMVGYKNPRYQYFGWFSARMDDGFNYVPARLSGLLLLGAAGLCGGSMRRGWRAWREDAHKHPSPNGGIPESVVAGALGVQLGGVNSYAGVVSVRARLGKATRPLERRDVLRVISYLDSAAWLLLAALTIGGAVYWRLSAG
ncbi:MULTISPECIES: adenosylcobinamide-phosphate synthase CbiB [Alicyclobacillus]|uniref:adenosylcobinamide-phosphate synthase CbiB n=1 Tax=Alicyclobacillus TaxID=29330 RepID=UPI00082BAB19|nr:MULTISPECIES: adenosylcobinamide-phosphate synthase CbiB [Alicyclobacillus]